MKFKKILLISLLLSLTVLTIGSVSASCENVTLAVEDDAIADCGDAEDILNSCDDSQQSAQNEDEDVLAGEYIYPEIEGPSMMIKGEDKNLEVEWPEDAEGNLSFYLNDIRMNATYKNGRHMIPLISLETGDYNFYIKYNSSDEKYESYEHYNAEYKIRIIENPNFRFTGRLVKNIESTLTVTGTADLTGRIELYMDDRNDYMYDASEYENGKATFTFYPKKEGITKFYYTYSDSNGWLDGNFEMNVDLFEKPVITAPNFQKDYLSKKKYQIRIKGCNGKYVGAGKTVTFIFYKSNRDYSYTGKKMATKIAKTDKNGYIKANFNLKPGYYKVKIKYGGATVTKKYTVNSIIKTKKVFAKKSKKIVLPLYLKKVDGKYLKGKKIKVTFLRFYTDKTGRDRKKAVKTFTVKTNRKGVATLKFKKSPFKISADEMRYGRGFSVKITYLNDVTYRLYTQYAKSPYKYYWSWGLMDTKTGLF